LIVAVLSDIHSNLAALEAVLGSLGSVDAVWHLGDAVGYGPEPDGVVERLEQIGAMGVKGNHDAAACGSDVLARFNTEGRIAAEWTRQRITPQTRRFLEKLPETLTPEDVPFTLAHGSPRDPIWEYVFSTDVAEENLAAFQTPYCLVGHTHVPVAFRRDQRRMRQMVPETDATLQLDERRAILNPGSVGQPRDGDPAASYAILDRSNLRITWRRVDYDIGATQRAILDAGLPARLARRLSFGQ
jgi:diadenosine tetraphosphatase ApaH/serine/threonine PP2A family protein phosphatase